MSKSKLKLDSKHQANLKKKREETEILLNSGYQTLKCEMCNFTSISSLISHITRTHAVGMQEYRTKFPKSSVQKMTPKAVKNNSNSQKERLKDPEKLSKFMEWRSFPSEIKHWTKKGFSEADALQKIAEFQSLQSLKGNNEKTRELRRKKNSGSANPMSLISIANRDSISIEEASKHTPCHGRNGKLHPMFGKKHTPEALKKIGQYINHSGKSKVEHSLSNLLIEIYGGEKNVPVAGWSCDYVNYDSKIIVELFGDFWHHNPKKYDINWVNPFTKRSSSFVWERDSRKIKELCEQGYEVIVIWECDWKTDREGQLKRIKDAYDRVR
jgi:G:T-mismatch repair DNA endonuclease (very short patch repair protein)